MDIDFPAIALPEEHAGLSFGAPERKLGIKGSPTRELYFDNCAIPADRLIGAAGAGFRIALRTLDPTGSRSRPRPWASRRARSTTPCGT